MSDDLTGYLGFRLTESGQQSLVDAGVMRGLTQSESAREAVREWSARVIAEGGRDHPREAPKNERELIIAGRRDLAVYCDVIDPILERGNSPTWDHHFSSAHRRFTAIELGGDMGLVHTISRLVDMDKVAEAENVLIPFVDCFFEENPGSDLVFSLPASDLTWMALKFGETPHAADFIDYVAGAVDRADAEARWRWARKLVKEMVARGVDAWRELFLYYPDTHSWKLVDRPRLKHAIVRGCRTVVETAEVPPDETPPPKIMTEAQGLTSGVLSPKIGADKPARVNRRNYIAGKP